MQPGPRWVPAGSRPWRQAAASPAPGWKRRLCPARGDGLGDPPQTPAPALIPRVPDGSGRETRLHPSSPTAPRGRSTGTVWGMTPRPQPGQSGTSAPRVALRDGAGRPGSGRHRGRAEEPGAPGMFSTCPRLHGAQSAYKDEATLGQGRGAGPAVLNPGSAKPWPPRLAPKHLGPLTPGS